ncbi:MAG: hypothetical protein H8D22_03000 [Candidatus Cloacimonetes bacterium]|nr:hypothetical protein [Candidatus Cloacimonadota bacterium]
MQYKRNHYMPITIIKNWVTESEKKTGVYVYNIKKKKKFFASAKDKRKFSFAVKNHLYVPEINQIRLTSVERWFSGQEANLTDFIKKLELFKNHNVIINLNTFSLSVLALIGLEYRSRYQINKIKEFLIKSSSVVEKISLEPDSNIDKIVLKNLIHVINDQTHKIMPAQLFVTHLSNPDLVLSDRPVIDSGESKVYIASSKMVVFIQKSELGVSKIELCNEDKDITEIINKQAVLQARDWIVASNESIINKYIQVINSEEYDKNLKKDKILIFKPKHLLTGYSIYD